MNTVSIVPAAPADREISSPPTDGISSLSWSPVAEYLACTSWDNQVRVWEVDSQGNSQPKVAVPHDAPPLCCAWMKDGMKLFSAGGAKQGKLLDLQTGQSMPFAEHSAPIKCAFFFDSSQMANILVTGSWDKTLKYWDSRTSASVLTVQLPERCYAMDMTSPMMTVATAERHVLVYDVNNPNAPMKSMSSPLKYQTRSIVNFLARDGFAMGSAEGRVAIQYLQETADKKNFSFKCHRDGNNAYSVNAMSLHPQFGSFSTAGSDGTFNFWDKDSKQRLKIFSAVGVPISCTAFNRTGNIFAYAASYDWSKGHEHHRKEVPDKIYLHSTVEYDVKPRAKR